MAEFYLDHKVARELAEHLRRAGHAARTARDLGMERASDDAHLSLAARAGWILVTHNAKDFILLHAAWRRWAREWGAEAHHAGILVMIPPVSPMRALHELLDLVRSNTDLTDDLCRWRTTATGRAQHAGLDL